MTTRIYEASVFSREVNYKNFKGEERSVTLYFALDPLKLLKLIAGFNPKTVKSGNPARRGQTEVTDEQQVQFVRDVCIAAAGEPSEDGETWDAFPEFESSIAGQAFLTKLASSDGDRKEFAEKVIIAPFRAYVEFATEDPTNTPKDVQQFKQMLAQVENIFAEVERPSETLDEKRARLAAEMAALGEDTPES